MAEYNATQAAGRRSFTSDQLDPANDKVKLDLETQQPSGMDSGSEGDDVGRQIELEAGNSIKYRTCSWQKVRRSRIRAHEKEKRA